MLCFVSMFQDFFIVLYTFLCLLILECLKFYVCFPFVPKQDELILLGSLPVYLDAVIILFSYLKLKHGYLLAA